jgi:2-polyprenyl-6-methoxyphenol hydroxylase-like FAD-dependent oxidoreductase
MHVLVIGGGVSGLNAALSLGRAGHRVTVVERDVTTASLPPSPSEAFAAWERQGAVQAFHSHAFLARLRNLLRDRAPDVLVSLLNAGATELPVGEILPATIVDRSAQPGDDDLVMLACRRITFEWNLRHAVAAIDGVGWESGAGVTSLVADRSGAVPRVTGVRLDDGREIGADLVIDASGRRSPILRWLDDIGASAPSEEIHECGILYFSRFYAFRDGAEPPPPAVANGDLGYLKFGIFRGDNRTFSLTMASYTDDRPMRALSSAEAFEAAARALPGTAPWVEADRCEPITDVTSMAKLRNRHRRFVVDGRPVALGLSVLGDGALCTNPMYGRGCTTGSLQAWLHTDALAAVTTGDTYDDEALALALDELTVREILPFYTSSVRQDADSMHARLVALGREEPNDAQLTVRSIIRDGLLPATRTDPVVFRAFLRNFNLLESPEALMANPDVVGRVMATWQTRDSRPPELPLGPDRDEMIALLAASTAA